MTAAWPWRSSGTKPAPSRRRAVMPCGPTGFRADRDRVRSSDWILSRKRVEEFALAIAGNAGDRQDLAGLDRQGRRPCSGTAKGVRVRQPKDCATRAARRPCCCGPVCVTVGDVAADHHAGERSRRLLPRIAGARDLAVAQHGGAVTDALHLLQPVADVEDRACPPPSA